MSLAGKTAFITGAGSGIGRATAIALLEAGANVYTLTLKQDEIESLVAEVKSDRLAYTVGSVGDEATVKAAFADCLAKFGTVDFMINNAGLGIATPDLSEADVKVFDLMFEVNVRGVFLCTREALKIMKPKQSGHVITLISMAGQRTNPGAPLYCSSKFAARGFNGGLADQCIKNHIKVTDINPGPVDSNYWGDRKVQREKFLKPQDVAGVIKFVFDQPEYMMIREINFDNINFLIK
ncbi:MAG: SDR family oxidoreductase [Victivallales bacterium]|nr:SDR family oxidoreductase [Victivallales bacterium]